MNSRAFENPVARSLILHFLLLGVALFFATHAPRILPKSEPIEISVLNPSHDSHRHQSIVQKSEGEEAKEAKPESYLSDKTRRVQEEHSARTAGTAALGRASQPETQVQPKPKLDLSDFGVKIPTRNRANYNEQRNWAKDQTGESIRGGQYIQGMKEGEVSALNTKEFVFYSYFERVRQQLDQAWQPILRGNLQRILKLGRHLASNTDFVTKTLVTMNARGEIVRIQVLEESGTQDLDQAAIDALNKAGPYPNPPKGLIDASGKVQIRWDFILKT